MRGAVYFAAAALVALTAFWTYRINYAAQEAGDRVTRLRNQIAREREALVVLRAEWAFLNAPDRLARLVARHGVTLDLAPMAGRHFATLADLPPIPPETFWVRADPGVFLTAETTPVAHGGAR